MQEKSVFVTVLAWIFIVFSALGLLILCLDAMVFWAMPLDKMMEQGAQSGAGQASPIAPAMFITLFRWFMLFMLLFEAWVLASSVGLLLRKNWARISFIVFIIIGLIWNALYLIVEVLAAIGIHFFQPANTPPAFQSFMQGFMVGFMILTIGFMVLFGWILRKLMSANIRREFVRAEVPATTEHE